MATMTETTSTITTDRGETWVTIRQPADFWGRRGEELSLPINGHLTVLIDLIAAAKNEWYTVLPSYPSLAALPAYAGEGIDGPHGRVLRELRDTIYRRLAHVGPGSGVDGLPLAMERLVSALEMVPGDDERSLRWCAGALESALAAIVEHYSLQGRYHHRELWTVTQRTWALWYGRMQDSLPRVHPIRLMGE